jgi:hypothetical protein
MIFNGIILYRKYMPGNIAMLGRKILAMPRKGYDQISCKKDKPAQLNIKEVNSTSNNQNNS